MTGPEKPETPAAARESRWLTTKGKRSDDGSWCTLLVVHEADGDWTVHGLGAPGVNLAADMVVLAEAILERSQ